MVEKDYFFYLSFENSLCKDYITEKFFSPMKRNIIPIVLGGALSGGSSARSNYKNDYTNGLGAPPHSFIDARAYENPKQLSDYVNSLYVSPELYAEYFWWKDFYKITPGTTPGQTYCDICRYLHEDEKLSKSSQQKTHKVIENLEDFWVKQSRCQRVRY